MAADITPSSTPPVELLNRLWRVAGPPPTDGSIVRQLLFQVRRAVAALLRPQETFNSTVVQFVNGLASEREREIERVLAKVDEMIRVRESFAARERRVEAGMNTLLAAHEELRASVGVLQQATQTLKHEVTRLATAGVHVSPGFAAATGAPSVPQTAALDSHKYLGFENQFRGAPEEIRARLREYVPIFTGASEVLDLGCGRGEFLSLLREHGVSARGVDVNQAMVQVCLEQGLQAQTADALAYLQAQPDQSLGGLLAAQVVEHLEPSYLASVLDAAFDKLRPGAPVVFETINPACWFAFFESYIRDISHVRPLHPDTLRYLLSAAGFQRIEIRYMAPYPEYDKLQPIPPTAVLGDSVETLNANVEKINRLLFTHLDYAAVGYRP